MKGVNLQALYMQGCKLVYKFVVDSLLLHCKGPFCKLSCTQRLVQSLHTILERCLSCCEVGCWWSWSAYGCASIAYSDIRKHGLQMQGFILQPHWPFSTVCLRLRNLLMKAAPHISLRAARNTSLLHHSILTTYYYHTDTIPCTTSYLSWCAAYS